MVLEPRRLQLRRQTFPQLEVQRPEERFAHRRIQGGVDAVIRVRATEAYGQRHEPLWFVERGNELIEDARDIAADAGERVPRHQRSCRRRDLQKVQEGELDEPWAVRLECAPTVPYQLLAIGGHGTPDAEGLLRSCI